MPFINKINAICICLLFIIIVSNYAYGKTGRSLRRLAKEKDTSKDVFKEHNRLSSGEHTQPRKDSKISGGESKGSDDSKGSSGYPEVLREDSKILRAKFIELDEERGDKSKEISNESEILTDESRILDGSSSEGKHIAQIQFLKKQAIRPPGSLWKKGTVLYRIDKNSYDNIIIRRILDAMKTIEAASCVIFKKHNKSLNHSFNWLHITNPEHERDCVHGIRFGHYGEAVMVLGFECMQLPDIIHALLHALGFKDEVTHPQRDLYVRILWENIQPKYHPLFAIQNEPSPYPTAVEYDTMSVMHFHDRAFSSNGGATITPLISGLLIHPSEGLSQLDVMKLRLAFGQECNKRKVDNLLLTCRNTILLGSRSNSDSSGDDSRGGDSKNSKGGDSKSMDDDSIIVKSSDKDGSGSDESVAGSEGDGTDSGSKEIAVEGISDNSVANKPHKNQSKDQPTKRYSGSKLGTVGEQKRSRGRRHGHTKPKHLKRSKKQMKAKQKQKKAKQKQMKSKQKQIRTKQKSKENKT